MLGRRWLLTACAAAALAAGAQVSLPAVAQAQTLGDCDRIEDRERRQRCRNGIHDRERYREEQRTWRQAEDDIRQHHRQGCRAVGVVGSAAGMGRAARTTCDAPRILNDMNQRRR